MTSSSSGSAASDLTDRSDRFDPTNRNDDIDSGDLAAIDNQRSRYILAAIGEDVLVCADVYVAEIIMAERNYLLSLPFYGNAMLGVIHYQGGIVPLISLRRVFKDLEALIPERLTVVHLSEFTPIAAGAGLVVDRIIGTIDAKQYAQRLKEEPNTTYINLEDLLSQIPAQVWQPQRW
ncbi:hypothetical protein Pse7367_2365 [Thalassoporum mexicanum PCC 7367]|uniref:chemotaxis protein CheW n=1 Tax=Thalassoporum mexicanum TaxID=3457544 RepID=UPI00029FFEEF|nr:chemotaxis protein CheW [Pseudanabaena sp. PCC 7367]AFY70626.1 hypothetical protein Pse7367_2365 [Pseudanabaena sp. PCC 7367]